MNSCSMFDMVLLVLVSSVGIAGCGLVLVLISAFAYEVFRDPK